MDRLIGELENVKRKASDVNATEHIEEIIKLAIKCRALENSRLIFTPF